MFLLGNGSGQQLNLTSILFALNSRVFHSIECLSRLSVTSPLKKISTQNYSIESYSIWSARVSKVSQRADRKASYQSFWNLLNIIEADKLENSGSGSNLIIFPIDLHFCSLIKLGGSLSSYHWYVSNPPQCLVLMYIWCFRGLLHGPDTLLTCLLSTQCLKDRNIKKKLHFHSITFTA